MKNVNEISSGRHCVFMLHVHLVFVTRYRCGVFTKKVLDGLQTIFSGVCRDFDADLVEFDGENDHALLLVTCPPTINAIELLEHGGCLANDRG